VAFLRIFYLAEKHVCRRCSSTQDMSNQYFETRSGCPVCTSARARTLLTLDYCQPPLRDYLTAFYGAQGTVEFQYLEEAQYVLEECLDCNLIYQKQIPNDQLMFRLYEKWLDPQRVFEKFEHSYPLSYYADYARVIHDVAAYKDRLPATLKVFDFAMGWGNWAVMAKAFGCDVYGSELSPRRIAHAEQAGIKVILWDQIPLQQFDFINTDQVLEHVADPVGTLGHLKRALKSDGVIRVCVPDGRQITGKLRAPVWTADKASPDSLNAVAPLEHINCFTNGSLRRLGAMVGLCEIAIPRMLNSSPISSYGRTEMIAQVARRTWQARKRALRSPTSEAGHETVGTDMYFRPL
jgi:SAM-dependent methyltransferase